ncbi:Uncharacterised protein [Dorea longicatena]|nr:Uncharacterised protein [Dorea longicatena]
MLRDSAHIQEFEAEWRNRKGRRAGKPVYEPIYTMEDAINAIDLLVPCEYGQRIRICDGVEIRFTDVGHISGSRNIRTQIDRRRKKCKAFRRTNRGACTY